MPQWFGPAGLMLLGLGWLPAATLAASQSATPDPAKTRAYIERAWTTLTRSMEDCGSLIDPKVVTRPVIYLPVQLPVAQLAEVSER
jgi:alpha,alpha-trehalase